MELASSPLYSDRVHVLKMIHTALEKVPLDVPATALIRASLTLMENMIKEDTPTIQFVAQTMLKVLREVIPRYPETQAEIPGLMTMAVGFAFARLGSTSRNVPRILIPFITELAKVT